MSASAPAVARPPRQGPRRSAMSMLVRTEGKLFLRERVGVVWGVVFPQVLLIIFGVIPGSRNPSKGLGGYSFVASYVPILTAFVLAMLALNALPPVLAGYRERGVLRRMATTPVGPWRVLAAQVVVALAVAATAIIVMLLIARFAFHVGLPGQVGGYLLVIVLAAAALIGVGLFIGALAANNRVANGVGAIVFFPLMFFAGLWLPRASMPAALRGVSDGTPLGAAVQGLQDATSGHFPQALSLGVLAAYAVVFGCLAVRFFRWD